MGSAREPIQSIKMVLAHDQNNKISGNQEFYIALMNGNPYVLTIDAYNPITKTTCIQMEYNNLFIRYRFYFIH